ncbi:E3 ubiquitin-protein ligase TRIM39-like [Gopherus evgoodei]|uniref:E3 ubiquitin-protein ligase TRIM39-like n=1 Tax=Gopherus evgoodei TaxID=1825980 RepID=UPI0011D01386|nr:E3 ubiquitin-protein ligase TRIM39-like [Gopherus evgoodei]
MARPGPSSVMAQRLSCGGAQGPVGKEAEEGLGLENRPLSQPWDQPLQAPEGTGWGEESWGWPCPGWVFSLTGERPPVWPQQIVQALNSLGSRGLGLISPACGPAPARSPSGSGGQELRAEEWGGINTLCLPSRLCRDTSPHPAPESPELEKRIRDFPRENNLQEAVTGFLGKGLAAERGLRRARGFAVDVTLDPDTAHPNLILSEDRKCVRRGDTHQGLPNNPERFDYSACVLGAQRFMGGRRYWEVEVGDKTRWALGVCRESLSRRGQVTLTPEDGYWTVRLRSGEYRALTFPSVPLPVSFRPSPVGIFLDYEGGEVSFYNVTDRSHLFAFTDTFSRTLHPYFHPGLSAGGKNAAPLIICPVPDQAGGN